jgi:transposase
MMRPAMATFDLEARSRRRRTRRDHPRLGLRSLHRSSGSAGSDRGGHPRPRGVDALPRMIRHPGRRLSRVGTATTVRAKPRLRQHRTRAGTADRSRWHVHQHRAVPCPSIGSDALPAVRNHQRRGRRVSQGPLSVPYRGKQWIACHECRAETSVQPGPRRPTCRHRAQAAGRLRRSWTATMTTSRTGLSNHEQRTNGPRVEEAVHLAEIAFHKARRRARESVGVRFGCHSDRHALRACRLASG